MRDRLLETLARWAVDHPGRTLALLALLTLLAASRLPLLGVDAGHSGMVDDDRPAQIRMRAFEARFGSPNQLILLVEGGEEGARRAAVDRLLVDLPGGPVRGALGRVDREALSEFGLWYLAPDEAGGLVDTLLGGGLARLRAVARPTDLLRALTDEIEARSGAPAPTTDAARAQGRRTLDGVGRLLDAMTRQLGPPGAPTLSAALAVGIDGGPGLSGLDGSGYLSSSDGSVKLVLVRPAIEGDEPRVVQPFVDAVDGRVRVAVASLGGGVTVTATGVPAMIVDEARAIDADMWKTGIYATAGLLLVLLTGYRSLRRTVLALAPLPVVLIWTLAFVQLCFGKLNLLTGAVVPVLLGLCIDASVHLLARYDEYRREVDVEAAVRAAIHGVGPGLLTGIFTTSGAFCALIVTDYRGFREMGAMTAFGLLAGLAVTSTLLPALLTLPRLTLFRDDVVQPPRAASAGRFVERFARPIVAVGVLASVVAVVVARPVPWSYDWAALLPVSPATEALVRLEREAGWSASGAAIEVGSAEEAARVALALSARASVARVEGVGDLVPVPSAVRRAALARLGPAVGAAGAPGASPDPEAFAAAAGDLADALEDAWFDARRTGAEQATWLEGPRKAAAALRDAITEVPVGERAARLGSLGEQVRGLRDRGLTMMRRGAVVPEAPAAEILAALPPALAGRFAQGDHYALYAYPAIDVGQAEGLKRFVADLNAVTDDATGFPVVHLDNMLAIEHGFDEASWLALVALVTLLLFDFRSLRYALLALVPLGVGVVWSWAAVTALGVAYNAGNVVSLPLMLGIAVDTGVHLLHRWRQQGERGVGEVVRYTGGAVLLSGITTLVGFGSLTLATHRATASFGATLLLGVSACLVGGVVFLPALLHLLGDRKGRTR